MVSLPLFHFDELVMKLLSLKLETLSHRYVVNQIPILFGFNKKNIINRRSLVVLDCHLISPRFYIIGVMRDDFDEWHLNQQLLISDCVSMICIVFFFDHR